MTFDKWYEKNYKKVLIIPAVLLILSVLYIGFFYAENGDIIYKDVSLTGGTSFSVQTDFLAKNLEVVLTDKGFNDFTVKGVNDGSGSHIEVIVTVSEAETDGMQEAIEEALGLTLTDENSSIEFTDSSLSDDFFKQLMVAVILAFFWMAAVVFVIFAKGAKVKIWTIIGNLAFAFFLGYYFFSLNIVMSIIIFLAFAAVFIRTYVKYSVPAFAVMLSAFADIVLTLAVVDLIGMRLSTAGIVAFLMLIGYSVDTDILLTTRVLNKKESTNKALFGAFKTGITMSVTSIIAVATALVVVYPFQSVLNQIFIILLIGLGFDLFSTWVANASILKWYAEEKL